MPAIPSLVAVIVALPGATAVTTPALDTVAAAGLFELQATVRPERTFPLPSLTTTISGAVCPTVRLLLGGATVTVATGTALTFTVAVVDLPSLVAVIVVLPAVRPLTTPLADTVADAGLLDDQLTARPVSTCPPASVVVGTSVTV